MTVKKAKKTGGSKKRKTGGSLYQSQAGRGIISTVANYLPGPLGMIAKMIGLGKKPTAVHKKKLHDYIKGMQSGGFDPMKYVKALVQAIGPIAAQDLGL